MRHPLLLLQATALAATPPGLSLGEWIALVSTGLVLASVIYRSGVSSAETKHTKEMAEGELKNVNAKLEEIALFMKESQRGEVALARWRGDIDMRIRRLEEWSDDDRRTGTPDRRSPE